MRAAAGEIVGAHRLLDPVHAALLVDHAAAPDRLGDGERLVEVDHQRDVRRRSPSSPRAALPSRPARVRPAHAQLHRAEALVDKLAASCADASRHDAEALGVVGADRARRGAEQRAPAAGRATGRARPRPPCRCRHREQHHVVHPEQCVSRAQLLLDLEGATSSPFTISAIASTSFASGARLCLPTEQIRASDDAPSVSRSMQQERRRGDVPMLVCSGRFIGAATARKRISGDLHSSISLRTRACASP